jgi:hypothetical protein
MQRTAEGAEGTEASNKELRLAIGVVSVSIAHLIANLQSLLSAFSAPCAVKET